MFKPFTGTTFGQRENPLAGVRLMLVLESHYTDDDPAYPPGTFGDADTTEAIEKYALRESNRTYDRLLRIVAGRRRSEMTPDEVAAVWNAVQVYNCVPYYISKDRKPSVKDWHAGYEPFRQVLASEPRPDVVLVCSVTAWDWIVNKSSGSERWQRHPAPYWLDGVPHAFITHPSRAGFETSRRVVESLLKLAEPRAD